MSPHKFGYDIRQHIGQQKFTTFRCDLRLQQNVQHEIAQFLLQMRDFVLVERFEDFIALFQKIIPQGLMRLLPVPRTALRRT